MTFILIHSNSNTIQLWHMLIWERNRMNHYKQKCDFRPVMGALKFYDDPTTGVRQSGLEREYNGCSYRWVCFCKRTGWLTLDKVLSGSQSVLDFFSGCLWLSCLHIHSLSKIHTSSSLAADLPKFLYMCVSRPQLSVLTHIHAYTCGLAWYVGRNSI